MSEHITHTAICDDGRRLSAALDAFPDRLKHAWETQQAAGQLGGITRQADNFSVGILERMRDTPADDADANAKIAFVLGALTHRSVDRHMKPIFDFFKKQDDYPGYNECTIYADVQTLQEVYADDDRVFPKGFLDRDTSPSREGLETLFQHVMRRSLVKLHTFKPQAKEGIDELEGWLDRFLGASQEFKIRVDRYLDIAGDPDPEKWRRYLVETNVYNRDAAILRLARKAQHGESVANDEVMQAMQGTGIADGRYARALARALEYLLAAGAFWRGEIDSEAATKAFDIGVPELSLTYPDQPSPAA